MAYNYTTLTGAKTVSGSIANWVNRSDLPTENILIEAEALIYERLRVREMTLTEPLSFTAGVQTVSLPSGFLDPLSFTPYTWAYPLPFVHETALDEYRDAAGVLMTGTPGRWTIIGETAYVDVLPIETFAGRVLYYKRPSALSVSNETNFLTTRYPTLLRTACLARSYEHMKDMQNAANYMQMAEAKIAEANATNEMWRRNQYMPA